MYFIVAFITFFSAVSFAGTDAVKEGSACHKSVVNAANYVVKNISGALGGVDECPDIEAQEIKTLSCKHDITVNVTAISHLRSFTRGESAEDAIFQIVARRSEAQLQCRNSVFDVFQSKKEFQNVFANTAAMQFQEQVKPVKALLDEKARLQSELKELDLEATDRGMGSATFEGREQYRKEIEELDKKIMARVAELPMGYEPEIGRAYVQMAAQQKFDGVMLANSVKVAQAKYRAAVNYYKAHTQRLDQETMLFCLDENFRSAAVKSGAATSALESVLGPGKNSFKDKLNCRLNATYKTGARNWKYAKNGALLLATLFSAPETLAAKGIIQLSEYKGLQTVAHLAATTAATATIQTLFLAAAIAQIHDGCFKESFDLSTGGEVTCDPYRDFQREISRNNPISCAVALGLNGGYYGMSAVKYVSKARAAIAVGKAARGVDQAIEPTSKPAKK